MSLIYATAWITLWARGLKVQVVPEFNCSGLIFYNVRPNNLPAINIMVNKIF